MTTAVKGARKSSKPRRTAEGKLPMNGDDVDLRAVLLAALTVPGQLSKCYNRFHRYSFMNMVLVFMQTGRLEPMANFKKWHALGRKVISGPGSALFVNHPLYNVYKRDEAGNILLDKDGHKIVAYKRYGPKATVFQLFQTDGPELTYPETPDWDRAQAVKELDLTEVPFADQDGNKQGYSQDRTFAINPVAEAPLKTAIHEWAHISFGHTTPDQLSKYREHRGIFEFQAEAVALLVCKELGVEGFDESASRAYIQNWLGPQTGDFVKDGELVDDSVVRSIFSVTDKILVAGRKRHYDKLSESEEVA
jgi:antirestriction protein ArdC